MEKLRLNDSSFNYEPESSGALGFGFRCGFLGLLHMEIVQERLEREFNLDLITTAPGVSYRVTTTKGEVVEVHNPSKLPPAGEHRDHRGADHHGDDHHAAGVPREHHEAVRRAARRAEQAQLSLEDARAARVRHAAERGRARLLRQAEIRLARLRLARLPPRGLSPRQARQDGPLGQRRVGRRAVGHLPSREVRDRRAARWPPR